MNLLKINGLHKPGRSMPRHVSIIGLIMLFLMQSSAYSYSENHWQLLFQPRQRIVKTIGIYNEQIFIGTGNGIYKSTDSGKTWQDFGTSQLRKDATGNSYINYLYIDKENEKIYIATNWGAYFSELDNPTWQQFFENSKTESNEINSLTLNKDIVYLSTNDGFWSCKSSKKSCTRKNQGLNPSSETGNHEIFFSLIKDNNLYLATSNGIYLYDEVTSAWQDISNGIQTLPDGRINARFLLTDSSSNLLAACGTGVYKLDSSKWKKVSTGIKKNNDGFQESFYLFSYLGNLYLASTSGTYIFNKDEEKWDDISSGIRTKDGIKNVYWISNLNDLLFAATDEGLFTNETSSDTKNKMVLKGKIEAGFANLEEIEPNVIEVQKQALKYASLPTTNDYKRYRLQARLRNLVPRVGFDVNSTDTNTDYSELDKGIGTNTSLTNSFNSDKTTRYQKDGRSFKQLSVLWDTNQFIYDNEIKDILSQARLTANIKENLLDDVTKIYYQRRKLQLDNLITPPENLTNKLIKELEVAELTGQLDSRTGGWFTREIEKRKKKLVKNYETN